MKFTILNRYSVLLVGALALVLVAALAPASAASPSSDFKKMFSKIDRQLCQSLSLANCKRLATRKKRNAKPVNPKPVKAKVARAAPADDNREATVLRPLPVLKKANPEAVPAVALEEKVRFPTPVLKPASLTREARIPAVPTPVEKKEPPVKPPEVKVVILPAPALPSLQPLPQIFPPALHGMPDGTPTGEACFNSLRKLGVKFTQLTTPVGSGACSVADAVQVQSISIGADTVKLTDQPTFNCGFAVKFASWVKDEANPIVNATSKTSIVSLGTGPGFQCRGRNGDISGKLSEHAFGNAVDIERIKLADGQTIEIKDAITSGAKYQPVLSALRAAGCQYFTTVLGPGANSAHASHFHFDLARRGKKGNHSMCQ